MVNKRIILILVSTRKFDFLCFMPTTVFYNLRNPFSTIFSLKIFEPFIAPLFSGLKKSRFLKSMLLPNFDSMLFIQESKNLE